MVINIIKNMESAPYMGSRFGQDVEVKGTYVLEKDFDSPVNTPWVEGKAEIKKPLMINVNDETLISYKYELAKKYKAKGQKLTNKLMSLGYDALITVLPNKSTGEIILFPNCNFMLNTNESRNFIKSLLRESLVNEASNNNTYVMYHGSPHKISKFSDDFVGGKDANDQEGPGVYFTSSLKNAMGYGENIYNVEITPKNPVSTKDGKNAPTKQIEWLIKQAPNWEDNAQNWDENPRVGLNIAVNDFIKYNDNPHQQFLQVWIDFYRYNPVEYVRNMVKLGYDSIIIDKLNSVLANEGDITHIIVLDLSIVKFIKMVDNDIA